MGKDRHSSKLIKTGCLQSSLGRPLVTKSSGTEDYKWLAQSCSCEDGKERADLRSRVFNRTSWLMGESSSRSRARVSTWAWVDWTFLSRRDPRDHRNGTSDERQLAWYTKRVFFEGLVMYPWRTSNSESSELYLLCPGIWSPQHLASLLSFEIPVRNKVKVSNKHTLRLLRQNSKLLLEVLEPPGLV